MIAISQFGEDYDATFTTIQYAVLPLASFEYHGPAAQLGTDYILAQHFADFLAKKPEAMVYPTVPYTACPAKTARERPTITIEGSVMLQYLTQILRGVAAGGLKRVLLLNAHDGNMGIARAAAEAVGDEGFSALLVNWWQLVAEDVTVPLFAGGGRGHGGAYELSAAYAAAGVERVNPHSMDIALTRLKTERPVVCVEATPDCFKGYSGCVSEAKRETGDMLLKQAEVALEHVIQQWLCHLNGGSDERINSDGNSKL